MKVFFFTLISVLVFFSTVAQVKSSPKSIQSTSNNAVLASPLVDTSKGYFLIKPGISEIYNGERGSGNSSLLRLDSSGMYFFRNDSALIQFKTIPETINADFPFLIMNPVTKEVHMTFLPHSNSNLLPEQSGKNGKFLKTNGESLSWESLPRIYVEDYSNLYPGNDHSIIQHAINDASNGDVIYLGDRVYELNSQIFISKSVDFVGQSNTVIRRGNEKLSVLKNSLLPTSNMVIVENPEFFTEGDQLILFKDSTWWGATQRGFVNKVSGDTLFLNAPIGTYNGEANDSYAAGTRVKKVFNLFALSSPNDVPTYSTGFKNIIFEGNRDNNRANLGFHHSWAILAQGKAPTHIINCTFKDMPTEAITGHNLRVLNSFFKDLNGSAIHFSINRKTTDSNFIHSEISNSIFINTNQISSDKVTSHSEGVFTTSNSGGYFTATNNRFRNCSEAIIGALYPSLSEFDYGTNEVIFTNNFIDSTKRLIYLIDWSTPGNISGVIIKDNSMNRIMQDLDLTPGLSMKGRETMVVQGYNSVPQSETLSLLAQSGASSGQVIKWNGSNWVADNEVGTPSGIDGNLQFKFNGVLKADSTLTWNEHSAMLGIGTSTPKSKLHVKGLGDLMRLETTSTSGSGTGYISFYDSLERKGFIGYGNTTDDQLSIFNQKNADLQLATNGVSGQFVLKPDGSIGVGTTSPNSSSIFHLHSTTKGFLTPRLTELQKNSILEPALGLLIFNLDSNNFEYFNGNSWQIIGGVVSNNVIKTVNENSYTLTASDLNATIAFLSSAPCTVFVPFGLQRGFVCNFIQMGLGNIEIISLNRNVEILNRQDFKKTAGQYAEAKLTAIAANTFVLSGDLKN